MYFKLPLKCHELMQPVSSRKGRKKDNIHVVDVKTSIHNLLHLLILTSFGEYRPDDSFGCGLWEREFDMSLDLKKVRQAIRSDLVAAIDKFEPRLMDVQVDISFFGRRSFSRKVSLTVSGKLTATAEAFEHCEMLFICPKTVVKK